MTISSMGMAHELETIRFHNSTLFVPGSTGTIDTKNCVVHGVSLITSDLTAEGHDLFVDKTCLDELHTLGSNLGQIPVNLDHGSGIMSMNGYVDSFRLDKGKWRGDWHLLKTHDETPVMLERCERQPGTFGLSLAFKGPKQGVKRGGKNCAHAEQLLSADCVCRPAANKGLFSVKDTESVDTEKKVMPEQSQAQQPTLEEVLQAVGEISTQLKSFKEIQDQLVEHVNQSVEGNDDPREALEALYKMTDAELARYNAANKTTITRAEIDAAVDEYNAEVEAAASAEVDAEAGKATTDKPSEGAVPANSEVDAGAVAAAAAGTTALAAMARELIQLKSGIAKENAAKKAQAEEIEFQAVETKINVLSEQRDAAIELAEKLVAENEALRLNGRTGARPAKATIELKEVSQGGTVLEFEKVVDAKYLEIKAANPTIKDVSARSQAYEFGIKRHPEAYQLYRKRGTPEVQFSVK